MKQANRTLSRRHNQGFTLVEMSIVMVIIGVILAAVMIGRDTQKNAEYLRIKQTFVNQWALAYNAYTQRYGVVPGDNPAAPTLAANGRVLLDGARPAAGSVPGALCGAANAAIGNDRKVASTDMIVLFRQAGVELPRGRGEGVHDAYAYLDSNGNPKELRVCFMWNPPGSAFGTGNVMVITGLTPDLARSLDNSLDGTVNAARGTFRKSNAANETDVDWGQNNASVAAAGGAASGAGADTSGDIDVVTLTAYYRMNQ
jgi:prepilin-type N-terminal cleavage/methylation domain-containing protein